MKNYFAVGNEELKNNPNCEDWAICPQCKKPHKVEYGTDSKTKKISKLIGFVNCKNGKMYLVAVNGKLV